MTAKKTPSPKPRYLTIGYQVYESRHKDRECRYRPRQVPFLRLSGDWLSAAGFAVGQKARIQVTDQGIVILPEG
ncbi:SymE family type I addiction module toxin [Xanthomonas campestris pv. campestris]|uniref:SymE family type I addiction module toxin n=1 Tax=Xanthomonas campestris TaxID=339 RepID=UPI00094B168A|nr:SymE family type I addiction module toxin [Xanthomonas campestris]MBD8249390.1 type I addiction module toxin, SymE family [Xanthomonas campestris]MCC5053489.1 type I toxin-antitoxin system SymE family toxin [Xanthomonas campestris pv. aberrans]MCC5075910.1 type I toxin-antitoxin system SymE family toxin [Xanthomonas campestris pv. campestris]MCC5098918.1 type I toxin-antitoxin system SymE family toxin [Xanthomonas campestris]MCF8792990.1 SymE family type I addiction module toxin [Xanthomona